jgi:hypothetical protein
MGGGKCYDLGNIPQSFQRGFTTKILPRVLQEQRSVQIVACLHETGHTACCLLVQFDLGTWYCRGKAGPRTCERVAIICLMSENSQEKENEGVMLPKLHAMNQQCGGLSPLFTTQDTWARAAVKRTSDFKAFSLWEDLHRMQSLAALCQLHFNTENLRKPSSCERPARGKCLLMFAWNAHSMKYI